MGFWRRFWVAKEDEPVVVPVEPVKEETPPAKVREVGIKGWSPTVGSRRFTDKQRKLKRLERLEIAIANEEAKTLKSPTHIENLKKEAKLLRLLLGVEG